MVAAGYKQTEIGVIPKDWNLSPLEDWCEPSGLVRGPFGGALKKEYFKERGYAVYEQRHAIHGVKTSFRYFIDEDKYRELIRFSVSPNDLIVSCSGTIGRIERIPEGSKRGVINQALLKVTLKEKYSSSFFVSVFRSDSFQSMITENSHGGAMPNLVGMDIFRQVPIQLPPPEEQKAIAEALSDVDALIESLEKLIAKKRAIKTATMQELVTGERKLSGFSNARRSVNIGKDTTLKARIGWQALTTAEYLDSGDYLLVTGTEFSNGKILWGKCHAVSKWRYQQDRNIQLKANDVLVTKDGTIGKVGYVHEVTKPATLNSGVFVIRPNNNSVTSRYLYYVLRSRIFDNFLNKITAGSTITHLYQKDFVTFDFDVPESPEEQEAVSRILTDMDNELFELEGRLTTTQNLKQGMMQELLTGKTRLVS